MNDLLADPRAWLGLITILGGIVAWFFQRELARVDRALAEMVRRDELNLLREDMGRRHNETSIKLDDIVDAVSEIRTKVAVLRARNGDDTAGDTGSHRRRL